jgi:hypothetical protein
MNALALKRGDLVQVRIIDGLLAVASINIINSFLNNLLIFRTLSYRYFQSLKLAKN